MKVGRPTDYSLELAIEICEKMAEGMPLTKVVKLPDMPSLSVVYKWLLENKEFVELYSRAREDQADTLADEIISIADDSSQDTMIIKQGGKMVEVENKEWVNRTRLRVDARKWVAAKLKPRKYADKIDVTTDGEKIKFNVSFNDGSTKGD